MQIALCIVSVLFGGLSLLAAVSQIKAKSEKKPLAAIIMAVGALILFAAAIMNGIKSGQFHIQHHIVRITLSVILTVGFIFL